MIEDSISQTFLKVKTIRKIIEKNVKMGFDSLAESPLTFLLPLPYTGMKGGGNHDGEIGELHRRAGLHDSCHEGSEGFGECCNSRHRL